MRWIGLLAVMRSETWERHSEHRQMATGGEGRAREANRIPYTRAADARWRESMVNPAFVKAEISPAAAAG